MHKVRPNWYLQIPLKMLTVRSRSMGPDKNMMPCQEGQTLTLEVSIAKTATICKFTGPPKTERDVGEAVAKVEQVVKVALPCLNQLQGKEKRDLAPRIELVSKMRGQELK